MEVNPGKRVFLNEQEKAHTIEDNVSERPGAFVGLGKDSKLGSHRKDKKGIVKFVIQIG